MMVPSIVRFEIETRVAVSDGGGGVEVKAGRKELRVCGQIGGDLLLKDRARTEVWSLAHAVVSIWRIFLIFD